MPSTRGALLSRRELRARVSNVINKEELTAPCDMDDSVKLIAAKCWSMFELSYSTEAAARSAWMTFFWDQTKAGNALFVQRDIYRYIKPVTIDGRKVRVMPTAHKSHSDHGYDFTSCDTTTSATAASDDAASDVPMRAVKQRRCATPCALGGLPPIAVPEGATDFSFLVHHSRR